MNSKIFASLLLVLVAVALVDAVSYGGYGGYGSYGGYGGTYRGNQPAVGNGYDVFVLQPMYRPYTQARSMNYGYRPGTNLYSNSWSGPGRYYSQPGGYSQRCYGLNCW